MSSGELDLVHQAILEGDLGQLKLAIANGDDVDALDRNGRTALFYAAREGRLAIAEELLRAGANPNAQDKSGQTPLHFAVSGYQPSAVELLIANGSSVDFKDAQGNTPLLRAIFESQGRGDIIVILCRNGADRRAENNHGVSPETLAESISNYDVTPFLDSCSTS
jgi:uncharacterized protein